MTLARSRIGKRGFFIRPEAEEGECFGFWLFSRICGRSENKLQLKLIITSYKLKSSNAFPVIRNDDFFSLSNRVEGNQSLILADRGGNPRS